MTLHDKRHISWEHLEYDEVYENGDIVYPEEDVKEAVKKLKKEICIHGVMYEHEVPCKCMNCECIKEIFGEGLLVEQSSTILEDSHPLGIHSPLTKAEHSGSGSRIDGDNIQNSEDKNE